MSDEDRSHWLELGHKDRQRYEQEKSQYKGPWKVPDIKDPKAPKRPMSAFLFFSNERRKDFVKAHPGMTGTEISRALSHMWHSCPVDIKNVYLEKEAKARERYREERATWENQRRDCTSSVAPSLDDSMTSRSSTTDDGSNFPSTTTTTTPVDTSLVYLPIHPTMGLYNRDSSEEIELFNDMELLSQSRRFSLDMTLQALDPYELTTGLFPDLTTTTNTSPLHCLSNESLLHHCKPSEKIDRFANFTIDDILESDELFEDFSPTLVKATNFYGGNM